MQRKGKETIGEWGRETQIALFMNGEPSRDGDLINLGRACQQEPGDISGALTFTITNDSPLWMNVPVTR